MKKISFVGRQVTNVKMDRSVGVQANTVQNFDFVELHASDVKSVEFMGLKGSIETVPKKRKQAECKLL